MNREAEAHLSALVKAGDEDRWLAARYAPAEARRPVGDPTRTPPPPQN